jgi:hypothetical protein
MYRPTAALRRRRYDTRLVMEAGINDILSDFTGLYDGKKKKAPRNSVILRFDLKGYRSGVLGLMKRISGAGVTGRSTLIGNEVDVDTREQLVYGNDFRHAINTEQYGIDANEKEPWGILEFTQPLLSEWVAEIRGKYAREAVVEKYSVNLTVAPHSLTKVWNENILVKGVTISTSDQPDYGGSASAAAYLEDIGDSLDAGSTTDNVWDVQFLNRIIYWATVVKKIKPRADGKYTVLVPSPDAARLKDPQSTVSIAGLFKDSNIMELADVGKSQYLSTFGPLDLFEDPRYPVLGLGGSNGSWTVTAYYKGAGDDDDRSPGSGTLYNCGMILGEHAILNGHYMAPKFVDELQDYEKIKGMGVAVGEAFQRSVFLNDDSSETRSKTINQSSGLLLCRAPTLKA